jgi:tRNA U34 5-carboxymethylaminomethyl modifying enzyme MnmG/GidA
MNTNDYIDDLNHLTYNPDDEVKMTASAFKTLLRNINLINTNLFKNQEDIAFIKRREDVNKSLAEEMEQILSSLKPKKKSKVNLKINYPKFVQSEERYMEELAKAPLTPLTPVPDYNDIINKLSSAIEEK